MSVTNSLHNLQQVVKSGLCTRCGSCAGLSDGAVNMTDKEGKYLPVFPADLKPEIADRLWQACSARDVDFKALNQFCFGSSERDSYIGHYRKMGISFSPDSDFRRECASGGILSRVLIWLLEQGEIKGAVVTGMNPSKPWLTKTFIARDKESILRAAKSKYIITSVNEILPEIKAFDGPLAYVGLPCQVHSIRKLQHLGDPAVANIKFILGPYCGNTLHFSSIAGLLRSYGEKDYRQINSLSFREGEWPGNTCVHLKSGREIKLKKFHANYLIPFHIMKRCLLCTDLANEFTDISGGDAWAPVYEERGKGFSLAIARSIEGERIIKAMIADGSLAFDDLEIEEVLAMHSHGFDLKKRGAFIRLAFRKLLRKPCPVYGYQVKAKKWRRYAMEVIIDIVFWIAGLRFSRFLVTKISPAWMGKIFEKLRTIWKKMTRSTKQLDLTPS